ncbi:AAA family ATPase [uncultured Desulfuromusa sp.]|uniref:bifunctional aminoglycoside phosphotransferase/ATP-binding protein n=1 Tax=uncultured Desulfuromusa sp. TaxID=219183 RepID=UPI002AA7A35E|nr:AAA family ATPase [uncultured Desulfuromusa sp.]
MQKPHIDLVDGLQNPSCYNHPANKVKLVETHISWVFLAGAFAYKLKKPVNFGFLDFSTLNKRHYYCLEELRLNRRFAPQLYLDVVSIGGSPEKPVIGGVPAIDYLVKMKRFSREDELDRLLQKNDLSAAIIRQFAGYLANIHQQAPQVAANSFFGSLASIWSPAQENFAQLRPLLTGAAHQLQLAELENWSRSRLDNLLSLITERKEQGYIRECHGDAHLANMVWFNEKPLLFDCIEFNDNLRCIDVINDTAFLTMDLENRGAKKLSWTFLNHYLQQNGDYPALPLLNYYKSYRALVRAKVIGLRLSQPGLDPIEQENNHNLLQSYLNLSSDYSQSRATPLIICHGFSGSGKSTFCNQLAATYGAVHILSDVERKRLHGFNSESKSHSGIEAGIYTWQASQKTYSRLQELAATIIKAGFPVIVDATFLKQQQRRKMRKLADQLQVPFAILDFPLSKTDLFHRVELRSRRKGEVSEATPAVLEQQLKTAQPLTTAEEQVTIKVQQDSSPDAIAARIEK